MKISKTGIVLVGIYLLFMSVCAISALFIGDPKGQFIVLQLPVMLQHGLLDLMGMTHLLAGMSLPVIYLVLGLPCVVLIMLLGIVMEIVARRVARLLG